MLLVSVTVEAGAKDTDTVPAEKGDVNCDGATDNKDVVVLFGYVSGVDYETFDKAAADFNKDNTVNNKDVTLLFRYISTYRKTTDEPVVLGIGDIGGSYLLYGSAEPDSVIRTVYTVTENNVEKSKITVNACNNKYFYIDVPVNEGDKISIYATAPDKLESKKVNVVITPTAKEDEHLVGVGKNSRIFLLSTYDFMSGNRADMTSLSTLKKYIINKTIVEIQKATGKKTKLIYAIVPDSSTAYYDEQNFYVEELTDSAMRAFVKEIDNCHEDVYALDLYPVMRAHRDEHIYLSTDTHYTELGAYYVYLEIMNRVREDHPDVTIRTIENGDYTVEYHDIPGGDLSSERTNLEMNEVVPFITANFEDTGSYYVSKVNDGIGINFNPRDWKQKDSKLNNSSNPTLYFLGDSFGYNMLPFIGANFSKVWTNKGIIWKYNLDKSILEKNKPDYVLLLVCQRRVISDFLNSSNQLYNFSTSVSKFDK